jgi:hypothetical protein
MISDFSRTTPSWTLKHQHRQKSHVGDSLIKEQDQRPGKKITAVVFKMVRQAPASWMAHEKQWPCGRKQAMVHQATNTEKTDSFKR